jgi:hypothetical protein
VSYAQKWFDVMVEPLLNWFRGLGTELAASLSDVAVWSAFAAALLFGSVAFVFGFWLARKLRLLSVTPPVGESLGVGLSFGLVVLASWWAAIASGGRSSLTPIAIAIVAAIAFRLRSSGDNDISPQMTSSSSVSVGSLARKWAVVAALAAAFVVVLGLLYGSTLAPSPRNGVQPVEFYDEAYYSVLGADLAATGTESVSFPSGFDNVPGLPTQSWYHWGELWLASAVIKLASIQPMLARHYVVLPLMLLAVAALSGTVVRRLAVTTSRSAFVSAAAAGIFLAPMPLLLAGFFGWWSRGSIHGITQYGLALIIGLLVLYAWATRPNRPSWPWSILVGAIVASLIATHIVIAIVASVGIAVVWVLRSAIYLVKERQLLAIPEGWRRVVVSAFLIGTATVIWGFLTGHGFAGTGSSASLPPYGGYWTVSVLATGVGGGVFLAIPVALWLGRRPARPTAWLFLATIVTVIAGALIWGARLGDFNMFQFFFGGIVVFGTPVAAVAVWTTVGHLRKVGRQPLATILMMFFGFQLLVGGVATIERLRAFGFNPNQGTPVELLAVIRSLPPSSKLAYACGPQEEIAFWLPALISIDAHTGRRVVPMCFEADLLSTLNGDGAFGKMESPLFRFAPQRALYPEFDAHPSLADVASFLKQHGIEYIYADARHPNSLVSGAVSVARSGTAELFRIP